MLQKRAFLFVFALRKAVVNRYKLLIVMEYNRRQKCAFIIFS